MDSAHTTLLLKRVNNGKIVQVFVQVISPSGGQALMVNTGLRVVAVDSSPQELIPYNTFHILHPCQQYWFPTTEAFNRELFILDFM